MKQLGEIIYVRSVYLVVDSAVTSSGEWRLSRERQYRADALHALLIRVPREEDTADGAERDRAKGQRWVFVRGVR